MFSVGTKPSKSFELDDVSCTFQRENKRDRVRDRDGENRRKREIKYPRKIRKTRWKLSLDWLVTCKTMMATTATAAWPTTF